MTAPVAKEKSKDPTAWGNYWESEFKYLKPKRGILQYEKLTKEEFKELVGLMVLECQKPPYNELDKVVIQRVISDAVLNDPDFIGFNVAWVRRTLNKWWHLSGYKLYDKIQREKEEKAEAERKKHATENPHLNVDVMLENYKRSLLAAKEVPKMESKEVAAKGAEWKSELEKKAVSKGFDIDHEKNMQINLQHEIYAATRDGYMHLTDVQKAEHRIIIVDGIYKVNCASPLDAELIYKEAKRRLNL
jgi:hypothetical protein